MYIIIVILIFKPIAETKGYFILNVRRVVLKCGMQPDIFLTTAISPLCIHLTN